MKLKNSLIGFVAFLVLSLSIPFVVFSVIKTSPSPLPLLGQVRDFVLKDSTGQAFHSDRLRGKVWIASFFFTTCSGVCPMISKNMASLSRAFKQVENVSFVSITVNPEQDSPETLALYAEKFGDKKNWHFLTGTREAITEVVAGSFKVGDIKEPVFHSTFFPLVDSQGFIRGYYDGTQQEELDRLLKDAVFLSEEVKK